MKKRKPVRRRNPSAATDPDPYLNLTDAVKAGWLRLPIAEYVLIHRLETHPQLEYFAVRRSKAFGDTAVEMWFDGRLDNEEHRELERLGFRMRTSSGFTKSGFGTDYLKSYDTPPGASDRQRNPRRGGVKRRSVRRRNPFKEAPTSALIERGVRMPMALYAKMEEEAQSTASNRAVLYPDGYTEDLILFLPSNHPLHWDVYEHLRPQASSVNYDYRGTFYHFAPARKANPRRRNGPKYERCVRKVKARGGAVNPWAVCTKSVGRNRNPSGKRRRLNPRSPHDYESLQLYVDYASNGSTALIVSERDVEDDNIVILVVDPPAPSGSRRFEIGFYDPKSPERKKLIPLAEAFGTIYPEGRIGWRGKGASAVVEEYGAWIDQVFEWFFRNLPEGDYTVRP